MKVFLSASGKVDAVVFEATNLPASVISEASIALSNTKYLPGYLHGDPVPSVMRWHLVLTPGSKTILRKNIQHEPEN